MRSADARGSTPARRPVRIDGPRGELAVTEVGAPERPLALVLHGAASSARFVVEAFGPAAAHAGLRLAAPDLRGHGRSHVARDARDHDLDALVDDLVRVVEVIGAPTLLGGVSLGAHVALRAVSSGRLAAPVALVAVLPSWLGRAPRGTGPHAAVARVVATSGIVAHREAVARDDAVAPWLRDALVTDLGANDGPSMVAVLSALDGGRAPEADEFARGATRAVVAGWRDDPLHPFEVARRWADGLGAVLVELDREAIGREGLASIGRRCVAPLEPLVPLD